MYYFGHVIRSGRVEVSTQTVEDIRGLKYAATVTDIRSFLGLCGLFVALLQISLMLFPAGKGATQRSAVELWQNNWRWNYHLRDAKGRIRGASCAGSFMFAGQSTVDTDACDKDIGRDMLQKQSHGTNRTIWHWAPSLNGDKWSYDMTDCTRLVEVLWTVLLPRNYLEGCISIVCTDHVALKWIWNVVDSAGKLTNTIIPPDFDVVHQEGIKHHGADALSWLKATGI